MTDHEIHDCIDQKNQVVINTVKELFDTHTTSIVTLITTENEAIKAHIKKLEDQVIRQNGSVRDLKEWRANHDGKEQEKESNNKRKLSSWQITGIIVAAFIGIATITMSIINTVKADRRDTKVQRVENWMELWDFSPVTRGGQPILDTTKFNYKSK